VAWGCSVSRLVDIPSLHLPEELVVEVGDVLRFAASGAHVRAGTALELVGILTDSVLGTNGRVISPMGPPTTVLLLAIERGRAVIDVVIGEPWRAPITKSLTVRVESAGV
jgi:hypothetical protein